MNNLVDELKHEHELITQTLNKIKDVGIGSEEGQSILLSARDALLAHLKKEDAHLYPPLRKAAEKNYALKQTLEFFARDMDKISENALSFFEKYTSGGNSMEFAKDFGTLKAGLSLRIRKEEHIIYTKFNSVTT